MKILLSIAKWGSYDNRDFAILYAGGEEGEAIIKAKDFRFPDDFNNYAWLEIWENGKLISRKDIIS